MDYRILVNKTNNISKDFKPDYLVNAQSKYKDDILLEEETLHSFRKLQEEALQFGYQIDIMSGYRSFDYQDKIYNDLVKEKGFNYALRAIAKPGCSEHQTGLALDFCVYDNDKCYVEHEILNFPATKWVHSNCHKYGFIVRYPMDKEEITSYNYEPWHLRYVGDLAVYLYNNDKTLEEYYLEKE